MIQVRFDAKGGTVPQKRWIKKVIQSALRVKATQIRNIGVLLTNDKGIQKINRQFLNHDRATDVIAFNLDKETADIVVSTEMANRVSKKLGISHKEELSRYLVHGTLHLLGYRDKTPHDKKKMWQIQESVLKNMESV